MDLSYQSDNVVNLMAGVNPGDPNYSSEISVYQAKVNNFQVQDSQLETQLHNIDTQQSECATELDAIKKVIDKNIDLVFKTFA